MGTDLIRLRKMHFSFQGKSFNAENTDEVLSLFTEESYAVVNGRVIQPGFSLEEYGLTEGFQVEEVPRMLGGKVHVLLPELVRSRDRPQRSTPRKRRRPRLDELSDECSTTDDSSTSSHPSARRRAPTRTLNRALSNNLHLQ